MDKTIYTFWELINEYPISIPQVQRDYAYGREEEKAKSVCENILSSMHDALIPETDAVPLTMDFVYGNIRKEAGLNPLDGQQRLTTLFLLHFYAAVKENHPNEKKILKRFCYETRQTANNFCQSMIDDDDFALNTDSGESLSKQITNSSKFLPSYNTDPTISSMLVVLDRIAEKFHDISNLWEKLTSERRIIFYFLPLSKFGLSDDLYIKMNSRGKALTKYELYKSDFLEFLENNYPSFKDVFSEKLDTVWTDTLWKHAESDSEGRKSVQDVDDGFINLFHNVSVMLYHIRTNQNFKEYKKGENEYLASPFSVQFTCKEDIEDVYNFFTLIENALTSDSMKQYREELFYQTDSVLGNGTDNIRIFWRNKGNIFTLPFRYKLTREQMVMFYALFIGIQKKMDFDDLKAHLRHLRNLASNSSSEMRGEKLHGMLTETGIYMTGGAFPTTNYFNTLQVEEELKKEKLSNWKEYWEYENHAILTGSLGLFLKKDNALDLLKHFSTLFDGSYVKNTQILRRAFLIAGEGYTDYAQYETYMHPVDKPWRRDKFVNNSSKWRDFFTLNNNRHNQDAIIECLERLPDTVTGLQQYVSDGLKKLSTKSWKYYIVKYPAEMQSIKEDSYGIYHWDDITSRPIEAIMLNSTEHSSSNLEWRVLNTTLKSQAEKGHTSLDTHGGAPVKLILANSYLTAVQEGWTVSTYEGHPLLERIQQTLSTDGLIKDSEDGISSTTVLVNDNVDYIEFGTELIHKIEELYSGLHPADNVGQTGN